ncbi:(2Fe-2S)-binding protein [Rhizohabitans arisaemae]|uniref:(2Fe-2S)-binding protein n=1 Tax=Rhizohabitans arisaemae TaxID=2720610 RepID=UPI0024B18C63|nr:(2Fe-2S)-binding protein [Rhizohabitans arisaemae]
MLTLEPLTPAPPETVAAALADVAALGSFFTLPIDGTGDGWRPVRDAYATGLEHLVAERAARYGTPELRIAASVVQLGHACRLWAPLLGCVVVHGVVPDLGDLRQRTDGPGLSLPEPRGWWAPCGETLVAVLYEQVVTGHLVPLAAGLRVKVATGLLYGNAASALAEAARDLRRARPDLRDSIAWLAGELLGTGKLRGKGEFTRPDLAFRRRTCCLYHRVPGGSRCGDCSLDRKRPSSRG